MASDQPLSGAPPGGDRPPQGQGKIHVDSDWKKEAQAEKERLASRVEAGGAAKASAPGAAPGAAPGPAAAAEPGRSLPPATFSTLVQTLATQAAIFMSGEHDPQTGEPVQNLELAKHNIDLVRVIEEKTRGNLAPDEKRLLETLLYELLMAYVSAAS
jgi:hypothetical protein